MKLILASTSPYRRELLKRLGVSFECAKPNLNEEEHKDLLIGPYALAQKLAFLKAQSLADQKNFILGADQLVHFQGDILGKPGTPEKALETLMKLSGQTHELITAACLISPQNEKFEILDITRIQFKTLSKEWIKKVIEWDNPIDCAGAYKIEAHGISLVEKIVSKDMTAIQGLPLIELSLMLEKCGLHKF